MKEQMRILMPSYVDDFKCIGGLCEDSCCIGWDIDIDKESYRKYSRTKNPLLKDKFKKHIYRNRDSYSKEIDFGRIEIKDNKWCPFLDNEKYCEIQKNLGEDFLSNVCYSFPRVYNVLNGTYELSLYMSCPEAVRKLFSSREPVKFKEQDMIPIKHIVNNYIDLSDRFWKNAPMQKLPELRSLSIDIIQNRNHSLHDRLLELGNMVSRISPFSSVDSLRESDSDMIGNKYEFRLEFFRYVIESLGEISENDSPVFFKHTSIVREEFELAAENSRNLKSSYYRDIVETIHKPFTEEHSHAFEHYLVNSIFQDNFPFSENENVFDSYVILVVKYSLIHFYLTGIAAREGTLVMEDLVRMIQVHTKIINHHKTFILNILMEMKRKGFDSLEALELLLD